MKNAVIFSAVVCGIIFAIPSILMPVSGGDGVYTPLVVKDVNTYAVDQAFLYAQGIKNVAEGNIVPSDPVIFENKPKISFMTPFFPSLVIGVISALLGSVQAAYMLGSFVFPVITFLLVYFFFFMATKNEKLAILTSFSLSLGFNFIATLPINAEVVKFYLSRLFLYPVEHIIYLGRLPHMQFTFMWLMLTLIFLYMALEKNKVLYYFLAGMNLGILFYSYFYYWTSISLAVGLLAIFHILRRDFKKSFRLFAVVAIALVVAAPYLVSLYQIPEGLYKDIGSRIGMESGFEWT